MRTIQLYGRLPDQDMQALEGQLIDESSFDLLVDGPEDTTVMLPTMEPLFIVRRHVVSPGMVQAMLPSFRRAAKEGDLTNRGMAVGKGSSQPTLKKDGTLSNTNRVNTKALPHLLNERGEVVSTGNIVGYMDAGTRFPACRLTAFAARQTSHWKWMQQYAQLASKVFQENNPDRYAVQRDWAERTTQDWIIPGTCFTTMTVNRNWQTAVHQDKGDLVQGCGVMGVIGNDHYQGLYFTYPRYRVACALRSGDIIVNNVHEWHANTPVHNAAPGWERISIVLYYREHMLYCATRTEEQQKMEDFLNTHPTARSYMGRKAEDGST